MKTVLYGGAFDPVHVGHLFIGREALRILAPAKLILIPTGLPNPDFDKSICASAADRKAMLQIAFSDMADVAVSEVELQRAGKPSYFIETLAALLPFIGPERPVLLVGEDQLLSFPKWYRYRDILKQTDLWFVPRAEIRRSPRPDLPARLLFDVNPFDNLSSTLIRDRIRAGFSIRELVPPGVAAYIMHHRLYQGTP